MKTQSNLRPQPLHSAVVKKVLSHRGSVPEINRAAMAIDRLGELWDSLDALYKNPDPELTREGQALRYKRRFETAIESAKRTATGAIEDLDALETRLVKEAESKAGLNEYLPEASAQEIRHVLRSLDQASRDKVVREAAHNADGKVIAAIRQSPASFVHGQISVPVEELVSLALAKAAPDLPDWKRDIELASSAVSYAAKRLFDEAEKRRDPIAEKRAEQQAARVKQAEADLIR